MMKITAGSNVTFFIEISVNYPTHDLRLRWCLFVMFTAIRKLNKEGRDYPFFNWTLFIVKFLDFFFHFHDFSKKWGSILGETPVWRSTLDSIKNKLKKDLNFHKFLTPTRICFIQLWPRCSINFGQSFHDQRHRIFDLRPKKSARSQSLINHIRPFICLIAWQVVDVTFQKSLHAVWHTLEYRK